MSKARYVPLKFLPARPPMTATILWPTVLHHWGAPQWAYGVIGMLLFILWAVWLYWSFNSEPLRDAPFIDRK